MADQFVRNIDLMTGLTKRNMLPSEHIAAVLPSDGRIYSRILWDDVILTNTGNLSGVVALGGSSSLVNCVSIGIQLSLFGTPSTLFGVGGGQSVILTVRDGNAGQNATTGQFKGYEVMPGEMICFESDETDADGKIKYLQPQNFSMQAIFPSLLITIVVVHIGYGVLSQ